MKRKVSRDCKRLQRRMWKLKHRDKLLAQKKRWRERHREDRQIYMKKWCAENKAHKAEYNRKYRSGNRDRYSRLQKNYYWRHHEAMLERGRQQYMMLKAVFMLDAKLYARHRAMVRFSRAKARGVLYKPRFRNRIPDYCVMNGYLDCRSAFLSVNLTASQKAYIKELYRERYAR